MKSVGPREAEALLSAGGVELIDVREPGEWNDGHLPGARLVPLGTLRANPKAALPRDKVLFVCAKGGRSGTAARIAEEAGLQEVWSLAGGTEAWAQAGLPIEVPAPANSLLAKSASAAAAAIGSNGSAAIGHSGSASPGNSGSAAPGNSASAGGVVAGSAATVSPGWEASVSAAPDTAAVPASAAEAEATPQLDAVIGVNLRALRSRRGLSLDATARITGVSRTTLGRIELGTHTPSIAVVWKIARAFEVPFAALLAAPGAVATAVLRHKNANRLVSADGRFSSRALFPFGAQNKVEFYELWLAAHGREEAEAHQAGTRENLVVAKGRLDLSVAGERHELAAGDAIVFAADLPHVYSNPANEECWMYLVMTYLDSTP